jgi:hypothetical protein
VLDLPALRIMKLGISLVLDLHLVWSRLIALSDSRR